MKSSYIINEAKEVKAFIEKNKALPKFCTINDNQYSIYTASYLFGKLLANITKTDISVKNVSGPSTGFKSTINEKILPADYKDMNTRFINYCEKNGKVPAYITTVKSKKQVQYSIFVYCLCKIIVFYFNNSKTLPAYCLFNSSDIKNTATTTTNTTTKTTSSTSTSSKTAKNTKCQNPYTSSPHLTTPQTGLGQDYPWDCSCAALQQCFYKLSGKKINESTLIKVMGVTTSGIGHEGFSTAIAWFNKKYGTKYKITWKNFSDLGNTRDKRFEALGKLLCKDNTAILTHIGYGNAGEKPITSSTKIFGHYECIDKINTKTKYVRALNSLGTKKNLNSYYGHLQERSFATQASFFANTPGGQKAICIITKT